MMEHPTPPQWQETSPIEQTASQQLPNPLQQMPVRRKRFEGKFQSLNPALAYSMTPYSDASHTKPNCEKIKRPMNAFMLWSQEQRRLITLNAPHEHTSDVAKKLGDKWSELSEAAKTEWRQESDRMLALHKREFPDYKYRPRKHGEAKLAKENVKRGRKRKVLTPSTPPGSASKYMPNILRDGGASRRRLMSNSESPIAQDNPHAPITSTPPTTAYTSVIAHEQQPQAQQQQPQAPPQQAVMHPTMEQYNQAQAARRQTGELMADPQTPPTYRQEMHSAYMAQQQQYHIQQQQQQYHMAQQQQQQQYPHLQQQYSTGYTYFTPPVKQDLQQQAGAVYHQMQAPTRNGYYQHQAPPSHMQAYAMATQGQQFNSPDSGYYGSPQTVQPQVAYAAQQQLQRTGGQTVYDQRFGTPGYHLPAGVEDVEYESSEGDLSAAPSPGDDATDLNTE